MLGEPSARLDGWKAIADYLGRDVRTAQRWRDERGMPVHRVPGPKGGGVFAYPLELDDWLQSKRDDPAAGTSQAIRAGDGPQIGDTSAESNNRAAAGRLTSKTGRRVAVFAAGLVAIGVITLTVIKIETAHAAVPARFELVGGTLVAHAADNSVVWSYRLPEQPGSQMDGAVVGELTLAGTASVDFGGKGDPDVVAFVAVKKMGETGWGAAVLRYALYCLSSHGTLRWTYSPSDHLAFAGRTFAGPWRHWAWVVLPGPGPRVWVSFVDHVWWPSFVVSLDGQGAAERVFVNAGHLVSMERIRGANGGYVLAGGVNNEYRTAALAVLDERGSPALSPQTAGSLFACEGCPAGSPRKYFLFPRSDVGAASGEPYGFADVITVPSTASDGFEVSVRDSFSLGLRTVYRFSADLTPESFAMSDRYWEAHREMSRNGKIDHSPEDCSDRKEVTVRMWRPDVGWSDIKVPSTFTPRESR